MKPYLWVRCWSVSVLFWLGLHESSEGSANPGRFHFGKCQRIHFWSSKERAQGWQGWSEGHSCHWLMGCLKTGRKPLYGHCSSSCFQLCKFKMPRSWVQGSNSSTGRSSVMPLFALCSATDCLVIAAIIFYSYCVIVLMCQEKTV